QEIIKMYYYISLIIILMNNFLRVLILLILSCSSLMSLGQCNLDVSDINELNKAKGFFYLEKNPKVELGDLKPAIYFECLSQEVKNEKIIIRFLLAQTLPKSNELNEDLEGEIYFVKKGKGKRIFC